MKLRLLFFFLMFSSLSGADEWVLKEPIVKRRTPYKCRRSAGAGEFEFVAQIVLKEVKGTAASILLGNMVNFGFDGKYKGRLFVEGTSIDEDLLLLDRTADHISAGEPFELKVTRDEKGAVVVSLNGREVYRNDRMAKKPVDFTFRPHRNTMDILSVKLSGDLQPRSPNIEFDWPMVPILRQGKVPNSKVTVRVEKARKIESFSFSRQRFGLSQDSLLPTYLNPGEHEFLFTDVIAKDTDLLDQIEPAVPTIVFSDGEKWTLEGDFEARRIGVPIHRQGEVDCHTTRIPALAKTKNKTLLGVYDLRYNSARDLQEHIDIGLSRSTDGGQTWEAPRAIMDMGEYGGKPQKENGVSDPNILVDPVTGRIFVSAVWTHGRPNTHQWQGKGSEPGFEIGVTAQFMVVTSDDDGLTWSEPQNWTRDLKKKEWWLFAPAPGNGIALGDGTLVMPTQGRDAEGLPFSNLMWSRDHGETWTLGGAARDDTTECAVAELSDGALLLNMRDNRNRKLKDETNGRALSVTRDLGVSWALHEGDHSALPEPVCMGSMISHKLADGRHVLLFSNPNDKNGRRKITIQASFDDGKTWPNRVLLDEGSGRGYSSLVMVDEETVGILYESSQANLVFQKVALKELL
jgi:sialidase-1